MIQRCSDSYLSVGVVTTPQTVPSDVVAELTLAITVTAPATVISEGAWPTPCLTLSSLISGGTEAGAVHSTAEPSIPAVTELGAVLAPATRGTAFLLTGEATVARLTAAGVGGNTPCNRKDINA